MPSFFENFDSVADWALEAGSEAGHLVSDGTPPAGSPGGGSAGAIIYDNTPGSGLFAYSRLDTVDGGVPTNTAWIVFAFYIADWNELWMGGAGAGSHAKLPGHALTNDPDTQSGNGFCPSLEPTSATTGIIQGFFTGPVSVTHQTWHTIRLGTKINGASSTEALWVDGVLEDSFSGNSGQTTGSFGPMFWDEDAFYTSATVYIDDLTWDPDSDPGEPTGGGGNGGGPGSGGGCDITVVLDGTDVTNIVVAGSSTRRLNRISQAQIRIPMDRAIGGPGSILKIYFGSTLHHHGRVLLCETDSGEDDGYTVYNSSDPMELWQWRPARDPDGDFSKPTFIEDNITGPAIMEAILTASENPALIPGAAEGPLFLDLGFFESGGVSLTGAPVDWPMTIAQIASLLVSTGELDIVITPTDPGGGIMGRVDCYNGDYGTDRTSTLKFQYGMGALNVRRIRWNEDMTSMCNKLWYYGGPRIKTPRDPAGDQHWCWNITADDPGLADPPQTTIEADRATSQTTYGVRMDIKIWDALGDLCLGPGLVDPGRELYRRLWQIESWIRQQPRELIHITPIRGFAIDAFDIGDLVTVEAGSQIRGGFSGAQRIYEYTISWDVDGVCELSEFQTSPTGEGI